MTLSGVQAGSPGSDGASPYPELCPTAPGELIPGRKDHPKPIATGPNLGPAANLRQLNDKIVIQSFSYSCTRPKGESLFKKPSLPTRRKEGFWAESRS